MTGERKSRGGCPICQTTIRPFDGLFGRGKTFFCRRCGARLKLARGKVGIGRGLALGGAGWLVGHSWQGSGPLLLGVLLGLALLVEWLLVPVKLAGNDNGAHADGKPPESAPSDRTPAGN